MSKKTQSQRKAFDFLSRKCTNQESFTLEEFRVATGLTTTSFATYLSKQFRDLLVQGGGSRYRVNLAFRQFSTWQKFHDQVVTQNRKLVRRYSPICYPNVMLFDFFMPLRNEECLRSALDSLFYKDSIIHRLRILDEESIKKWFPTANLSADHRFNEVCDWISNTFGGYSINHVSGRFKADALMSRRDVLTAEIENGSLRYLVDETTAVVRFVFPVGDPVSPVTKELDLGDTERQANRIRWFFEKLFVETILEVINGEDEVWLLESGFRNQLHRFKAID